MSKRKQPLLIILVILSFIESFAECTPIFGLGKIFSRPSHSSYEPIREVNMSPIFEHSILVPLFTEKKDALFIASVSNGSRLLDHERSLFYDSEPMIVAAIQRNNIALVEAVISSGANLNLKRAKGTKGTALHWAAFEGDVEITSILIKAGANVNLRGDGRLKRTALHRAAQKGNLQVVRLLIEAGADVTIKDDGESKSTPLHLAADNGHFEIVKVLINAVKVASKDPKDLVTAKIAYVNLRQNGEHKLTALHFAAQNGHLQIVNSLIAAGADVKIRSGEYDMYTPLHLSALSGHVECIKALITGVKSDLNNPRDIVEAEKAYVNMEEQGSYKRTALYLAAQNGHFQACKALIAAGADISIRNAQSGHHFAQSRLVIERAIMALLDEALIHQRQPKLPTKNENGRNLERSM